MKYAIDSHEPIVGRIYKLDRDGIWNDAYTLILNRSSDTIFFLRENGKIVSNSVRSFVYCMEAGTLYEVK
jgi:hypothetical protein